MIYAEEDEMRHIDDGGTPSTAGGLHYLLIEMLVDYWMAGGAGFQAFTEVLGVLEACKLETQSWDLDSEYGGEELYEL